MNCFKIILHVIVTSIKQFTDLTGILIFCFYRFNQVEMAFLGEYTAVMKPVCMALNVLQGESSVHMGFLLLTHYQLQEKLRRLQSTSKVCGPFLNALEHGIQKHFGDGMKDPEMIAASIPLSKFRTSWTTEESIFKAGHKSSLIKNGIFWLSFRLLTYVQVRFGGLYHH